MVDGRSGKLSIQSIALAAIAVACVQAFAQSPPSEAPSSEVADKTSQSSRDQAMDRKSVRAELSEVDLQVTMAFALEHHPELARLLEHLKKSRPAEFQRAMRELNQQMQGLEKVRERNPSRYDHNLKLWKTDSQIRVLVAKWSQAKDEKLEREIRELLKQRREAKLAQLHAEHMRLSDQLRKLESQMNSLSESHEEQIDREWDQLARKTNASRKIGIRNVPKNATGSDTKKKTGS